MNLSRQFATQFSGATVPDSLEPSAVAAHILQSALTLSGSEGALLAIKTESFGHRQLEVLATHAVDPEIILDVPSVYSAVQGALQSEQNQGGWQWLTNVPLHGMAQQVKAQTWLLQPHKQESMGLVLLLRSESSQSHKEPDLREAARHWANQLLAACLLDSRIRDPLTGLRSREELERGLRQRNSGFLIVLELGTTDEQSVRLLGPLLSRGLLIPSPLYQISPHVFALLLKHSEESLLDRIPERLRQLLDQHHSVVEPAIAGFHLKNLDHLSESPEKLLAMARRSLTQTQSESAGSLRGLKIQWVLPDPTATGSDFSETPILLQSLPASRREQALEFLFESLLSQEDKSESREEFWAHLMPDCIAWLGAERGQVMKLGKAEPELGCWNNLGESIPGFEIPTAFFKELTSQSSRHRRPTRSRRRRSTKISSRVTGHWNHGQAPSVHSNHNRTLVGVRLRGTSGDPVLIFEANKARPFERQRVLVFESLAPLIRRSLELLKMRERVTRDRTELKALRERLEYMESQHTGELMPVADTPRPAPTHGRYHKIIGRSPAMQRVLRILDRITDSDVPVLIQGETGTGKELIARALHEHSPRHDCPFITLNCSALSVDLMESELFGHKRGAFTGATEDKEGYFEQAHEGTLFLDEVQDMSPTMQRELLRVLQDGEFQRVGGKRLIKVDIRVVAAANRRLKDLVAQGLFRLDLFYRLNVVTMELPPLRQRREDIPDLVMHFLRVLCKRYTLSQPKIERLALERLKAHNWPGNIRELQNLLEKTLLMLDQNVIRDRDIQFEAMTNLSQAKMENYFDEPYKVAKEKFLKEYLTAVLAKHRGNVTKAAEDADLVRSSFHKMMRKHGLSAKDFSQE